MLVQKHYLGTTTFNRQWRDYKTGFYDGIGDYWIGNDQLHVLSAIGRYKVRFELMASNGQWYWAEYSTFKVENETEHYELSISGYTGTAGDCMARHNGYAFATPDRVDPWGCATGLYGNNGGFWYNYCSYANINGSPSIYSQNGVESFQWRCLPVGGNSYLLMSRVWLVSMRRFSLTSDSTLYYTANECEVRT
jgi:hypothetical protein